MSDQDIIQTATTAKRLSVVVVSDFEPGAKTWADEIGMVKALAAQDIGIEFDVVIVESAAHKGAPPPKELTETFPNVQLLYFDAERSAALKDYGVSQCGSEWVAVFEADAHPAPDWMRHMMRATDENPGYDVFSGRTWYGDESAWKRVLNLLDRSFDDLGADGPAEIISNNGALFRTAALKKFPYPEAATPFLSCRYRNQALREGGHKVYFVRDALTRHAIGGLGFVMDVRRNLGFADMMSTEAPSLKRLPHEMVRRTAFDWRNVARLHGRYWSWREWPLGAAMFVLVRFPEIVGMVEALQKRDALKGSAYR